MARFKISARYIRNFVFGVEDGEMKTAIKLYYGSVDVGVVESILGKMEVPSREYEPAEWRKEQVLKRFKGRKSGDKFVPIFTINDVLGRHVGHKIDDKIDDVGFILTNNGVIVGYGQDITSGEKLMMTDWEKIMDKDDGQRLIDGGVAVDWYPDAENAIKTADGKIHIIDVGYLKINVVNEVVDYWNGVKSLNDGSS